MRGEVLSDEAVCRVVENHLHTGDRRVGSRSRVLALFDQMCGKAG